MSTVGDLTSARALHPADCPHVRRRPEWFTDCTDQWYGERCLTCGSLRDVESLGPARWIEERDAS